MPHYIPPEITDAIISAVASEDMFVDGARTHTLAMCALVCRAWLPRSRAKLFEVVWISNQRSYDLLVERVLRSETMSRYPTSVNGFHIYNENAEGSLGSAARLFLVEFAGKLPGLRDLFVLDNDWTLQRPSVKWPLLLSRFHTITTLRLENCRFSCFSDVRRLLTALPLISALDIWYLTWPTVSQELHLPSTLRSRTYWQS
ncbi:hypothetical protein L227DRAFT_68629 [Lentinus tigrinus ALCF2SS1-6]|uniref:F-box domain-containing protein n=1 Tax=Lentinus tigrinus ALCF2SS1-6 TaxID=1328759 RepID=A0A5C2SC77_9APHY|nr:hypothetical protein L227DRAFT_68629 [Lentinus tigrinus ALCF2SS1-6]